MNTLTEKKNKFCTNCSKCKRYFYDKWKMRGDNSLWPTDYWPTYLGGKETVRKHFYFSAAAQKTRKLTPTNVSAGSRLAVRIIIVILSFGFFDLTLLCVPHDHLIDLTQHFRRQALAEIHHQRRVKGQLFVIIARIPTKVLQVRVLLDHKGSFFI